MEANQWTYKVGHSNEEKDEKFFVSQLDIDGLEIKQISENEYHILYNNHSFMVTSVSIDLLTKRVEFEMNENKQVYTIQDNLDVLIEKMGLDLVSESHQNEIVAPMPGTVLSVEVTENEEVTKGQTLVILEAMKMENTIKAAVDSTIKTIYVKKGDAVDKDQILVSI